MKYKVTILWGRDTEPGDKGITYEFKTKAELVAFKQGAEEAIGWMEYQEVEEGHVVPEEEDS